MYRVEVFGQRIVQNIPDEARTFGMEGIFRQLGIYPSVSQLYEPVDKEQVMFCREDKKGQILEEPITFDMLIVDETHRLNEKSGLYGNLRENQIKELIESSKCLFGRHARWRLREPSCKQAPPVVRRGFAPDQPTRRTFG